MAKRKKNFFRNIKKNKSIFNSISLPEMPRIDLDPEVKRGILSIFLLTLGAIGVLGLFDMAGLLGQYYIKLTAAILGWGKAYLPFLMIILGYLIYKKDEHEFKPANYFGLFLLILSFQTLLELFVPRELWKEALAGGYGGGYVGYYLGGGSIRLMGIYASYLVAIALILVSLMLFLERNLSALIGAESPLSFIYGFFSYIAGKFRREEADEGEEKEGEEREEEEDGADEEEAEKEAEDGEDEEEEDEEEEPEFEKHDIKTFVLEAKRAEPSHWKKSGVRINIPLDLLSAKISKPTSGDINANKTIIERTLINFNIPVEMAEVSVGPTVTQYTFKPADGIKLSRITNLSNDLALALAAHPIRIEAPIPGRSLVGIEVPNHAKAIVGLREILTSREFLEKKSNSMIALGKDVTAKAWIYDLTKMPHLLVAGATGSGKSVCLNSIIVSLLYQNSPDDLRFIMVDPKRVELPVYNGIPHLCAPVITDVEKTINALRWCLNEMDKRLDILNKTHKRDIQGYNMSVKEKLPYIVFIIDELADLMVVSSKEVETAVIRLAQMARAVGIHLILATQRPSVNVITGLIKTNMPVRIAFSVPQSVDSRTILDSLGAEKLLGSGDMLFLSPEISKPKRLQGAFVSELEVKRIVRFIKDQVDGPNYIEGITEKQKVKGIAGTGMNKYNSEDSDELFEEAKEVVINIGRASTSLLQRKLSIGYGRAAKLIDLLEAAGIVGAANGSKPREILVSKDEYARMGSVGISGVPLHRREERTAPDEYLDGDLDEEEEEDEGEEEQNEEDAESEIEDEEENEKEAEHKNEDKKRERANERPENVRRTSRDPGQNKQRAEKNSFDKDHDFRLFSK